MIQPREALSTARLPPSSASHVLPSAAATAVEGLEALCHRPRAVLRLPLHRDEVEACARRRQRSEAAATLRQLGEGRGGMLRSRAAGTWGFRNGRLLTALPRAQIHRMRCDHLSPTMPRPPSPILSVLAAAAAAEAARSDLNSALSAARRPRVQCAPCPDETSGLNLGREL